MKKGIVLTLFAALAALVVYSYQNGPAFQGGIDGTAASGGGGCNDGSCHASSNTNNTIVELDSAGQPVTTYYPGMAYTVKVSASNSSANNWPRFGFQMTVVKLAGSGTTPVDAGTWGTLPDSVRLTTPAESHLTETIIEHNTPLGATSGSGGIGTKYVKSIPWTAPAAGTGSVVVYGVINEVNFDGTNQGDGYQVANHITITEGTPAPIASVQIALTSGSNPACANSSLTFTATPANGGTAPTYQWQVNGSNAGTGVTFTTSALTNGQIVTCIMTSNLSGVTGSPATSNAITVTVNPTVTPSVHIVAADTTICPNQADTFTATATNSGTIPAYQWKKNGAAISGATASTYITSTLANGDVITVQLISNANCATPDTVTSGAINMVVGTTVAPAVSISATDTTICQNQSVTFTATPTNGGAAPEYQWRKNGTAISGANSATYTSTTLANNDVITVVMLSDANCASPPAATSHAITMVVGTNVVPAVSINAPSTNICPNQNVTFTATPVNGGTAPTYQWRSGGVAINGATSSTYSSTTLTNGQVISVVMTSNANCATPDTALSNALTMVVGTAVVPSVRIAVNDSNLCSDQTANFTAVVTNGGTAPTYQWKKGGVAISGATSATYVSLTPDSGDVISVVITSNANCASPDTATSNAITLHVTQSVTPSVTISSNGGNSLCINQSITLTATPVGGGTAPTYQWYKNGSAIVGANSATYATSGIVNNDVITCKLSSNAACATQDTAISDPITFTVVSSVTPSIFIFADEGNTDCAGLPFTILSSATGGGDNPGYEWFDNNVLIPGADSASLVSTTLSNNDVITCKLTSSAGCASPTTATSNTVTVTAIPTVVPSVSLAALVTTVCNGQSVTLNATPTNGGSEPNYEFFVNGTSVQSDIISTFTSTTLTNNSVVTVVLTGNAECASIATDTSNSVTITVKPVATSSISHTICQGDTFLGRFATGIYHDTATGSNGCDSIRTLNLTVNPITTSSLTHTICQGDTFLGRTATGVYNDTLNGSLGCDSIRTLHLTVNPVTFSHINHTICPGSSYLGHDTAGIYVDTLNNALGCDSVRTLNLAVNNISFDTIPRAICHGDSVVFAGVAYTQAGSYTDTFTSVGGCDSVVTLVLIVNALPVVTLSWDTLLADHSFGIYSVGGGAYWCQFYYPDSIRLEGGTPTGGTYNGNGVSGNVFYGQVAVTQGETLDTVTYTYTDSNSCRASAIDSIRLPICEGIATINPNNLFTIYPNPANDYVMIDFDAGYTGSTIFVKDITGREVLQMRLETSPQQLPTGILPSGVYLVTLYNNGQIGARLLVKQ